MTTKLSPEATAKKIERNKRYISDFTTKITLNINHRTDADILSYLSTKPNKQGFVKEAIRERMDRDGFIYSPEDTDNEHVEKYP